MMKCFLVILAVAVCRSGGMMLPRPPPPIFDDGSGSGSGSGGDEPFHCWDREGTFVSQDQVCDGVKDCDNEYDEDIWACAQKNDEFVCDDWPDPTVIPNVATCDGVPDCPVSEYSWRWSNVSTDENKYMCHEEDEFPCDDSTVIPVSLKCDGQHDCPVENHGWDENNKTWSADEDLWECKPEGMFICWMDNKYIEESRLCDGEPDCSVSPYSDRNTTEDEILYNCDIDQNVTFICWGGESSVDRSVMCNGVDDCPKDEWLGIGSDENKYECAKDDEFVCSAKQTIKLSQRCDKKNDCTSQDEEQWACDYYKNQNYTTEFHCGWGEDEMVLTLDKVCDGVNDCVSRDEESWECPDKDKDKDDKDDDKDKDKDKDKDDDKDKDEDKDNNVSTNVITRELKRRHVMKERDLDDYLKRRGIKRRSARRM